MAPWVPPLVAALVLLGLTAVTTGWLHAAMTLVVAVLGWVSGVLLERSRTGR